MISVTEAKDIINSNATALAPVKSILTLADGKILAENVYSSISSPPFDQSSMDGYAFSFKDWKLNQTLKVRGEIAAGINEEAGFSPGTAIRIFTGAPLPSWTDTVVMQEKTKVQNDQLVIEDDSITQGLNVRISGSEIKAGELALEKGALLTPPAIGFLASLGRTDVLIYPCPSISVIVTGNELQVPGKPLKRGQVYESNSFSLQAALKQLHINEVKFCKVEDTLEAVIQVLKEQLLQSDVILLTGGISGGDYDFVLQAATDCGVEKLFHKVKQRPGKPLYFGKKTAVNDAGSRSKIILGLPGNPSSVLTCFYQYVIPVLENLSGRKKVLQTVRVPLAKPFQKNTRLTHFLKGIYDGKTATPLDAQESYRLSSFAIANCLIQIDEEITFLKEGESVDVFLLPA